MKISYCDRFTFKNTLPNLKNAVCISISDTPAEVEQIEGIRHDPTVDLLTLKFYDDDESFNEGQASKIMEYIEWANTSKKDLLIHCYAGVSRSATVAMVAGEYLGIETGLDGYKLYNRHVRDLLIEAWYEKI